MKTSQSLGTNPSTDHSPSFGYFSCIYVNSKVLDEHLQCTGPVVLVSTSPPHCTAGPGCHLDTGHRRVSAAHHYWSQISRDEVESLWCILLIRCLAI